MHDIKVQFKEFAGPLDLLLSLLEEKKMEINEISISAVTEPFLHYLDSLEEVEAKELADFLVIAAKLLLLKSKTLLPQFAPEGDEEGMSLEEQLRLYRKFILVSKKIDKLWNKKRQAYGRVEPLVHPTEVYIPENLRLDTLHESMLQLITRLAPPKPLPESSIDKTVSLREKVNLLQKLLQGSKEVSFSRLLSNSGSRTEVVVSFLALLELVKQKNIYLKQKHSFDDITIGLV